jgi:hypothetical protein
VVIGTDCIGSCKSIRSRSRQPQFKSCYSTKLDLYVFTSICTSENVDICTSENVDRCTSEKVDRCTSENVDRCTSVLLFH